MIKNCIVRHLCKNKKCVNPEHLYIQEWKTSHGIGSPVVPGAEVTG